MTVDARASRVTTAGRLQIGDVSERTGLSLRTVRHYEEVGLLPPADRSAGGFRLYTEAAVERLLVVRRMKPLEFTLDQMRELLDAVDELGDRPSSTQRRQAQQVVAGYRVLVEERTALLRERLRAAKTLQDSLDELLLG